MVLHPSLIVYTLYLCSEKVLYQMKGIGIEKFQMVLKPSARGVGTIIVTSDQCRSI